MSEQRGSNHKLYIYEADSFAPLAQVQLSGKAGTGADTDTDTDNSKPKQALALASQAPAAIKIELPDDDEGEWQPRKTAAAFAQQMRALQLQTMARVRGQFESEEPADFDDTLPLDFDDTLPPEEPDQPGSHKVVRLKDWRVRYYHNDHLGTPRELSDEDGSIVWQATYKAWGNPLRVQAARPQPQPLQNQELSAQATEALQAQYDPNPQELPIEQNLRFQGQYFDEETGLHYNRFRYYDPDVGRFVSQDPIGLWGGSNLFAYAVNPTGWIDPLGLDTASDAEKLAANLTACGTARPSSRHRAHHIVMSNSNDPQMVALRNKMSALGVDINDATNGIWLPETVGDKMPGEIRTAHKGEGVHGKDYKKQVYDKLINAKDKDDFLRDLAEIKGDLEGGKVFCCCRKPSIGRTRRP